MFGTVVADGVLIPPFEVHRRVDRILCVANHVEPVGKLDHVFRRKRLRQISSLTLVFITLEEFILFSLDEHHKLPILCLFHLVDGALVNRLVAQSDRLIGDLFEFVIAAELIGGIGPLSAAV